MADEERQRYITRSGRISKQKFTSFNFTERKNTRKMPTFREDPINENATQSSSLESEWERLRKERENLEKLREEIQREKEEILQTQGRVNRDDAHIIQQNSGNSAEGIVKALSNIQNLHIEIILPKFQNETLKNPVEFLDELEKYFRVRNIKEEKKIFVTEHALEEKASLWFHLKEQFRNFEDFKVQFLEEFYSIPIRVRFKKSWMESHCDLQRETLLNYFYRQLQKSRYFIPRISDFEVNYNIIYQYPH